MQRGRMEVWTIHRSNQCIPARAVRVPVETKFRDSGPQPRAYLMGTGVVVDSGNGLFHIVTSDVARRMSGTVIQ